MVVDIITCVMHEHTGISIHCGSWGRGAGAGGACGGLGGGGGGGRGLMLVAVVKHVYTTCTFFMH